MHMLNSCQGFSKLSVTSAQNVCNECWGRVSMAYPSINLKLIIINNVISSILLQFEASITTVEASKHATKNKIFPDCFVTVGSTS